MPKSANGATDAIGHGIRRNTTINLAGSAVPIVVSLVTVPLYLEVLDLSRYGTLIVAWTLLGYFGGFDLGLSRATANLVAKSPGDRQRSTVVWTALGLGGVVGVLGGLFLVLVGYVIAEVAVLAEESDTLQGLPLLALAVPLTNTFWLFVGSIEGKERFWPANILLVSAVVLSQLIPLGAALRTDGDMTWVMCGVTLAALANALIGFVACSKVVPLRRPPCFDGYLARRLVRYGSWVMVTGLITPVLASFDRIVIGAALGPAAVAQYAIPSNLVNRLTILPVSIGRTLFPRMSRLDSGKAIVLQRGSLLSSALLMTPIVILSMLLIEPFLRAWVGDEVADTGGPVGEILLLGIWLTAVASVPYAYLQARNRPDLPAKFHLIELPLYLVALWVGLEAWGIEGAAWAWTFRAALDCVLLLVVARVALDVVGRLVAAAGLVALSYAATRAIDTRDLRVVVLFGALLLALAALVARMLWSRRDEAAAARST
jgi:O-antigen/teichoic acid export membrane protein